MITFISFWHRFGLLPAFTIKLKAMASFYIILEITALLAVIILSITGPKKKKASPKTEMSGFAVNADGYLEHFKNSPEYHQPVE
ncbi:hypothetical protein ACFFGT_07165 [Mucilaginibacter angelicae]|uniref:Uncharacterized protein n=1 Tax=Mucilaginibacter angelicae TaxID=869718 RepID=A0ABV6L325_9SPHI